VLTAHLGDVPVWRPVKKLAGGFGWLEPFTKPIWKRAKRVVAVSDSPVQLRHYSIIL